MDRSRRQTSSHLLNRLIGTNKASELDYFAQKSVHERKEIEDLSDLTEMT